MRSTSSGATPFDAASPAVRLTYLEEPARESWSNSEAPLPGGVHPAALNTAALNATVPHPSGPHPRPQDSGVLVAQRYELESPEGGRGPGGFWNGRQLRSRRPVTLQLLDPAIVEDAVLMEAFLHEASLAAAIDHPHVARLLDYGIDYELNDGVPFLVLERLTGETLARRLAHQRRLSLAELTQVLGQAALGLEAMHERGLVHRRLDPAHLILSDDFPSGSFRAGTFAAGSFDMDNDGLAGCTLTRLLFAIDEGFRESLSLVHKLSHQLASSALRSNLGAPRESERRARWDADQYQSPEQLLGHGPVDARSDLWSLAVIAFEALTGTPAFSGATLGERLVRICSGEPNAAPAELALPPGFDAWFRKGVSKLPSERFASAREMSDALCHL